jgi:hypothetical protein
MDEADPPSPKQETNMNDDLLTDEELSIVADGKPGDGTSPGTDGLGWLRNLVRGVSASDAESVSARRRPPNGRSPPAD